MRNFISPLTRFTKVLPRLVRPTLVLFILLITPELALASGLPVLDRVSEWVIGILTGQVALYLSFGAYATVLVDIFKTHRIQWWLLILISVAASVLLSINSNVHTWVGM